jgi:hypothetical protein
MLLGVEIDGDGEPPMSGPGGRVVAMRPEEARILGAVAGDDIALDAAHRELEGFLDLRHQTGMDALRQRIAQGGILDRHVIATLEIGIELSDRFPVLGAHEPRSARLPLLIDADERLAELWLQDPGNEQHRRPQLGRGAGMVRRQGHRLEGRNEDVGTLDTAAGVNAKHRVENHPIGPIVLLRTLAATPQRAI